MSDLDKRMRLLARGYVKQKERERLQQQVRNRDYEINKQRKKSAKAQKLNRQIQKQVGNSKIGRALMGAVYGFNTNLAPVSYSKKAADLGYKSYTPTAAAAESGDTSKKTAQFNKSLESSKAYKIGHGIGNFGATAIQFATGGLFTKPLAGKVIGSKVGQKVTQGAVKKLAAMGSKEAAQKHVLNSLIRKGLLKGAEKNGYGASSKLLDKYINDQAKRYVGRVAAESTRDVLDDVTTGLYRDTAKAQEAGVNLKDLKQAVPYYAKGAGQNLAMGFITNGLAPIVSNARKSGQFYDTVEENINGRVHYSKVPNYGREIKAKTAAKDIDYMQLMKNKGVQTKLGRVPLKQYEHMTGDTLQDIIADNYTPHNIKVARRQADVLFDELHKKVKQADNNSVDTANQALKRRMKAMNENKSAVDSYNQGIKKTVNELSASELAEEKKRLAKGNVGYKQQYAWGGEGQFENKYIRDTNESLLDMLVPNRTADSYFKHYTDEGSALEYARIHNMTPTEARTWAKDRIAEMRGYRKLTKQEQNTLAEQTKRAEHQQTASEMIDDFATMPDADALVKTGANTPVTIKAAKQNVTTDNITPQKNVSDNAVQAQNVTDEAPRDVKKIVNSTVTPDAKSVYVGEKPNAEEYRRVEGFQRTGAETTKRSKAADTNINYSVKTDDELKKEVDDILTDSGMTNKWSQTHADAMESAKSRIRGDGYDASFTTLRQKFNSNERWSDTDVATGALVNRELYRRVENAKASGDKALYESCMKDYTDFISMEVVQASEAGKTLAAQKILKNATPDGRVAGVTAAVKKLGEKTGVDNLLPDKELMHMLYNVKTQEDIDEINEAIFVDVWNRVPATTLEKLHAWRYMAMLFNPRTHMRNIVGNAAFIPVRGVRNILEGGLQRVFSGKLNGEKTITYLGNSAEDKAYKSFAEEAWDRQNRRAYLGTNMKYGEELQRVEGAHIFNEKHLFGKIANKASETDNNLLNLEDEWFAAPAYKSAYAQYLKAHHVDLKAITEDMREKAGQYAMKRAQEATYRANNALAEYLQSAKREALKTKRDFKNLAPEAAKQLKIKRGVGAAIEVAQPFLKTPLNIAYTGVIDFNPAQLINGTVRLIKAKDPEVALDAIHKMANGMTGTGLYTLGAYLAHKKILHAKNEGDAQGYYDKDRGYQDYSFTIAGKKFSAPDILDFIASDKNMDDINGKKYSVTADWAVPAILPLFIGATIYNAVTGGEDIEADDAEVLGNLTKVFKAMSALPQIAEPMFDMTMLSSLNEILDTGKADEYGVKPITMMGENLAKSALGQFIPTGVSQITSTIQNAQRDTNTTELSGNAGFIERAGRQQMAKIPGLNKMLPYRRDKFGEKIKEKQQGTDYVWSAVENFLSPATVREIRNTDVDKEYQDLVKNGGQSAEYVYPMAKQRKYINTNDLDGNKMRLSVNDVSRYNEKYLKARVRLSKELFKTEEYNNASYADKFSMLSRIDKEADAEARRDLLKQRGYSDFECDYSLLSDNKREKFNEKYGKLKKVESDLSKEQYMKVFNNVGKFSDRGGHKHDSYVYNTMAAVEGGIRKKKDAIAATGANDTTWAKILNLYKAKVDSEKIYKYAITEDEYDKCANETTKNYRTRRTLDEKKLALYIQQKSIPEKDKWIMFEVNRTEGMTNPFRSPF